MSKENIGNRNATDEHQSERIDWDHPSIKFGFAPGYLIREMVGWTDATWKKKYRTWPFCKTLNGEAWVSLQGFEEYLRTTAIQDDSDD